MKKLRSIPLYTALAGRAVLAGCILSGCVLLSGCRKNLLDVQPTNLLTQDELFSSPAGVTAYFASLYADLPIEDFGFCNGTFESFPANGTGYLADWTDESSEGLGTQAIGLNNNTYDNIYAGIRNVNFFLQQVRLVPGLDPTVVAQYIAEAQFIRAYDYFELVKFYGGVPLLTMPQDKPTPLPRNKEVEVWNQIKSDLDSSAAGLPATSDYGRANKYVALALEARAMLHAASVGKFGDPAVLTATQGINGVDAATAQTYMQAAYQAAQTIINAGVYSLYMQYPQDLSQNFQYLFYQCGPGQTNPEAIFCRGYDYAATASIGGTHNQDLMVLPYAIESPSGYGDRLQPSLDMAELFENVDGSPHQLGGAGQVLQYYHFPTMAAAFAKKDPRFAGTIVATGTYFRLDTITSQRGVIVGGQEIAGSTYAQYYNPAAKTFSQNQSAGSIVGTGNSDYSQYPFWLKKWTDPVTPRAALNPWTSLTSWMDLRYGEVLLDYAESSFELGHPPAEAQQALNLVRARAGILPIADPGYVTEDTIRHERLVELSFENKTYWDYIRWRTLTTYFNQRQIYACRVFYDMDTHDYVFYKINDIEGPRTYTSKQYYFDLPGQDFASDPLLVHNPGY
ncbi:MAG TPA: RagB/SusD family nutrient uptake outer membrane protein [Dinghuibacter sp.]|uniref:RagB/SusD family nutrient uptake outer membrane protein n=1 Tax=Dinghuibacter sp. TaxID=2024697 RepID=UPI002CCED8F5|nr:RagB/SusD family nutrient uptake outer membrane protein [Dinghuibacter sp.]HTJ11791.1 RagB/SusD family nutrient uptake outer membrane protein [Dinghuibacter sp.]